MLAEFETEAQLRAHYSAVRERLNRPPKPKALPPPPVPEIVPSLEDEIARRTTSKERVRHMIGVVCWWFHITKDEFHADRRSPLYVFPHWVAIYLTSRMTHWSLYEIGRKFNRDHTSVIHSIRQIKKLCCTDPATNQLIETLESYYVD